MSDKKSDMVFLGGLWPMRNGGLSGKLGMGGKIIVLPIPEDRRKDERSPTHNIFIAPYERREQKTEEEF